MESPKSTILFLYFLFNDLFNDLFFVSLKNKLNVKIVE